MVLHPSYSAGCAAMTNLSFKSLQSGKVEN
ncbi:hypothetical protein AVEN_178075-1, partial [Araneus ventricosus]